MEQTENKTYSLDARNKSARKAIDELLRSQLQNDNVWEINFIEKSLEISIKTYDGWNIILNPIPYAKIVDVTSAYRSGKIEFTISNYRKRFYFLSEFLSFCERDRILKRAYRIFFKKYRRLVKSWNNDSERTKMEALEAFENSIAGNF